GRLTEIQVSGNQRLRSPYIRNRLALAGDPPLQLDDLVEQLRLLQLDPLIDNISAELATELEPGTGTLMVTVDEADTFRMDIFTDNERSPTVGSWQRGLAIAEANLTGRGDGILVDYTNTNGSNEVNASYTIPVNPRNGTVNISYGFTTSNVIEDPFDTLDIESESRYYDLTYRQPIIETPSEEFALSLTASRQESRSLFLENLLGDPIPFPALGADEDGRIRVSALRFAQEWVRQGAKNVVAVRSQFNIGLDLFDPTINDDAPDSRFVSWQGQAQWVNLLAEDTLLILRGEAQLTGDSLVPLEQIGLGGQRTVLGYRQDLLLTDNGLLASAEVRLPVYRNPQHNSLVQLIPFVKVGTGWNVGDSIPTPSPNTIVGTGIGVQWQQGDRFTARFDWGIPLTAVDSGEGTLQEDGIYFSIRYSAF
ncbi:MAG: ShlB/FhaC/HecB family hemolysin secretion/activation protein, partial [Cyanothece sp. SIO2G6]|nr:ShlB/FhaC/HecB family hemolysin secretion/activation protein [Cyanothece sp. SIO2G6]